MTTTSWRPLAIVLSLTIAFSLGVSACGSADDGVSVSDVWARPTAPGANNAAFYPIIDNAGDDDDLLVSASSDRCGVTEIHQTTMSDGVMSMSEADPSLLSVPAGGTLVMEPGAIHVMCMMLDQPFVEGETVSLTLEFESAPSVDLEVPVEQR